MYPDDFVEKAAREEIPMCIMKDTYISSDGSQHIITYDKLHHPILLSAIYEGKNLKCNINNKYVINVENGSHTEIPEETITDTGKINIRLYFDNEQSGTVVQLCLYLLNMMAIPVDTQDIKTVNHPEIGMTIGFNLHRAFELAAGFEEFLHQQAQIRTPDGNIINLIKESIDFSKLYHLFRWRSDILMLNLLVGKNYALRTKFSTSDREIEWSNWMPFSIRRKKY